MSTPGKYDDAFRRQMDTYREMPSGAVWAGVEAALDKKKKRRLFAWFWLAGTGMSVTALAGYLLLVIPSHDTSGTQAARRVFLPPSVSYGSRADHTHTRIKKTTAGTETAAEAQQIPSQAGYGPGTQTLPRTKHTPLSARIRRHAGTPSPAPDVHFSATRPRATGQPVQTPAVQPAVTPTPVPPADGYPEPARDPVSVHIATLGPRLLPGPEQQPFVLLRTFGGEPVTSLHPAPRVQFLFSVQGNAGAVRYVRSHAAVPDSAGKNPRYGTYTGLSLKGGVILARHWYVAAGIGYETHIFSGRYRIQVPGISNTPNQPGLPTSELADPDWLVTDFGNFNTHTEPQDFLNLPGSLPGRLVYQNHQLVFPVDIGYRFTYRRMALLLAANATFALPLAQRAVFYADNGTPHTISPVSPLARYNVSFGFEPTFEYAFSRHFSLLAGGRFAYSVNGMYRQTTDVIRPYTLGGHVGLRMTLAAKPAVR